MFINLFNVTCIEQFYNYYIKRIKKSIVFFHYSFKNLFLHMKFVMVFYLKFILYIWFIVKKDIINFKSLILNSKLTVNTAVVTVALNVEQGYAVVNKISFQPF